MTRFSRCIAVAAAGLWLAGCNYWLAGHSEDYTLIIHGQGVINMETQTSVLDFTVDGSDLKCSGTTTMVEKRPEIVGSRGKAEIKCNDGRKAAGDLVITSLEGGTGSGTDECGNTVQLVWNIHEEKVKGLLESYRQTATTRKVSFSDKCDAPGDAPPHHDPLI
jgi:hypothetical protein